MPGTSAVRVKDPNHRNLDSVGGKRCDWAGPLLRPHPSHSVFSCNSVAAAVFPLYVSKRNLASKKERQFIQVC